MSVTQQTLLLEVADIFDVPSYGGLVLAPALAMPAHRIVDQGYEFDRRDGEWYFLMQNEYVILGHSSRQ